MEIDLIGPSLADQLSATSLDPDAAAIHEEKHVGCDVLGPLHDVLLAPR